MLAAILLVILTALYRVATAIIVQHGGSAWLSNFAPMAAIALCSAVYLPRKFKFSVPFAALLLSDVILDAYYGASLFDPIASRATSPLDWLDCLASRLLNARR